jgi:serine/threonine-protein kinase
VSEASEELVDAVARALERADVRGRAGTAWLRGTFRGTWDSVREALDTGRRLGPREECPATIGPFRPIRRLGRGATGTVYLAEASEPVLGLARGRRVALKVTHPHLCARDGMAARVLREARAGALVRHPGVVRSHGAVEVTGEGGPSWAVAMDWARGATLRRLLDDGTTFSEAECVHVGRQVADALAAIHAAGVVHRDVKPANLLRSPTGRVRLLDLGLAWVHDEALRLSVSGTFLGTFLYAAPEQVLRHGGRTDARSDLYSLGVTLFELAVGHLPWGPRPGPWVHPVRDGMGPPRLRDVAPHISSGFASVVDRLLAPSPAGRFPDAAAVRDALADVVSPPAQAAAGAAASGAGALRAVADAWAAVRRGGSRAVLLAGRSYASCRSAADRLVDRIERGGCEVVVYREQARDVAGSAPVALRWDLERADVPSRRRLVAALTAREGRGTLVLGAVRSEDVEAWAGLPEARDLIAFARVEEPEAPAADSLDGLAREDVLLLCQAASLGDVFDPDDLVALSRRSNLDVARTLSHLARERPLLEWLPDGRVRLRASVASALRARVAEAQGAAG